MLALDFAFFAVAAPAVVFAGISKGGFGSGAAFLAMLILLLVLEPGTALGIMLPLLMLIDVASLRAFWGKWRWQESRALIIGAVPGIALGALIYLWINDDVFRVLIGGLAVAYVLWQQMNARRGGDTVLLPVWLGFPAGALAGFTSFVSHAGGPPAAVYLLGRGLSKTQYQASSVIVFWVINLCKFPAYAGLGMFTPQTLLACLWLAPFALLGTWIGVKSHHLVPERPFFFVVNLLLLATGLRLLWVGLT